MLISVTILVKNGERLLENVLISLKSFDEVLLIDTGSSDRTLEIAKKFSNVKIYQQEFVGFGKTHNEAAEKATHDWIFSVDSDEIVSSALCEEIASLSLDLDSVYSVCRRNFFNGKEITFAGWQKEKCFRLYNRKKTAFSQNLVHEGVITAGLKKIALKGALLHTPYASLSDFLKKMELYSSLFAAEKKGKKRASPLIAVCHGLGAFFKSFFLKKGFLGGYEGFLISVYNGHTAFYKYLKLYHANRS